MTFDGSTQDPMKHAVRDALIGFMAATAQAQAEVLKEAQRAGIAHAQAHDDGTKYRGRKPTFTPTQFQLVQNLLNQGIGISAIAKASSSRERFRRSVGHCTVKPWTRRCKSSKAQNRFTAVGRVAAIRSQVF